MQSGICIHITPIELLYAVAYTFVRHLEPQDLNKLKQTRVNDQLVRLERERDRLIDQFNRLEAALASLDAARRQIDAAFGNNSKKN